MDATDATGTSREDLLIGRAAEMLELERAAKAVLADKQLHMVSVLGAPGIGKSRIVREFVAKTRRGALTQLRVVSASGKDAGGSSGILAKLLRARFGMGERSGASPLVTRRRIEKEVSSVLDEKDVRDVLFFLGQAMGLSFPDSALTRVVEQGAPEGEILRRSVLRTLLAKDASKRPLALIIEDMDQASIESLHLLHDLLEDLDAPILIVAVARTEIDAILPSWRTLNQQHHTVVDVQPLGDHECSAVMENLLGFCKQVPEQLVDAACGMAGGNPSLLEQMVRIFLDTGVLEEDTSAEDALWIAHVDRLPSVRLPLTVEEVVRARVSALTSEQRTLLERAAVMGSVFWRGGLVVMARGQAQAPKHWIPGEGEEAKQLDALLDELVERDYILELPDSTFINEREFAFKHNLEREQIAALLSEDKALELHKTVADWLEQQRQDDMQDEFWEYIARHRDRAGEHVEAGLAYLDAGDVARSRYAWRRAVKHYQKGFSLLGDHQLWRRIDALHNLGDVQMSLGQLDEALAVFEQMREHAYRLNLHHKGGAAHNRIGRALRDAGKLEDAAGHLEAGLALFERAGDERGIASSLDDIGKLQWMRGQYPEALEQMGKALAMRRHIGDRRSIALSLNNMGLAQQDSGMFREALASFEQALSIRREIGDRMGAVITLSNLGTIAQDQAYYPRAASIFEEALAMAEELGDKFRIALVLVNLGEARRALGQIDQAVRDLERSVALSEDLQDDLSVAEALRVLALVLMDRNEVGRARDSISRAVDIFTKARSKSHLGVALRSLAEVTAGGGWGSEHVKRASEYFDRSVKMLEQIGYEVELAKTLVAYSDFLAREVPEQQQQIQQMRLRAREVFERLGIAQEHAEQS